MTRRPPARPARRLAALALLLAATLGVAESGPAVDAAAPDRDEPATVLLEAPEPDEAATVPVVAPEPDEPATVADAGTHLEADPRANGSPVTEPGETERSPMTEPGETERSPAAEAGAARAEDPVAVAAAAAAHSERIRAWRARIDMLELGLVSGATRQTEVDQAFGALSAELWPLQADVHRAVREHVPDLVERHAELAALYALRSRLFGMISPELRFTLSGLNPLGRAEARRELDYFAANLEYQQVILEGGLGQLRANFERGPLAALSRLGQIVLAVLVFRGWRRWAKEGLPAWRKAILAARPRRPGALRRAQALWYLDRMRRPLEWLVLVWVVTSLVQPQGFEELSTLARTIVKWLFIGALAVLLIDARATRTTRRANAEGARLRMRSLRLVGYWGVLFGLAADLTARYAGAGVIHNWVLRGGIVTALPIALLLVHWWRGPIFERLAAAPEKSDFVVRLLGRQQGFGSYTAAVLGAAFVVRDAAIQALVRGLSGYEFGRRVIAQLVRREVAREGERVTRPDETAIADEVILPLIASRDVRIDGVAKLQLEVVRRSLLAHRGGSHAIIGERGAGKTIFLEQLAESLDGAMRIVDCPVGGYEAVEQAIADTFEIAPGDGFAGRLQDALEKSGTTAVAFDDAHRLPRPWLGGQRDLARLVALTDAIAAHVSWVFAVDKHAWRYIMLASGESALLQQTIELPPWTEEQLAGLVDARAAAAGVDPDYERLVLPRQLDTSDVDDAEQRNRLGYARILWELADGNPEVSLYLFAESMRRTGDGSVLLRLPQLSSPAALVDAHLDAMFALRVLVQCDVASVDDVARSLKLPPERVLEILRFCAQNGWVTEELGGHRVSWRWFRSVTRALVRRNLMAR